MPNKPILGSSIGGVDMIGGGYPQGVPMGGPHPGVLKGGGGVQSQRVRVGSRDSPGWSSTFKMPGGSSRYGALSRSQDGCTVSGPEGPRWTQCDTVLDPIRDPGVYRFGRVRPPSPYRCMGRGDRISPRPMDVRLTVSQWVRPDAFRRIRTVVEDSLND